MKVRVVLPLVLAVGLAGCDQLKQPDAVQRSDDEPVAAQSGAAEDAERRTDEKQQADQPQAAQLERVEATAGVGKKGQRLNQPHVNRAIAEPARALFAVQQQLEFDKVKHAVQLYKAMHGRVPETHEQFMKEIVEANYIKLPELPAGHRYVWDPQEEKLMVERPAD